MQAHPTMKRKGGNIWSRGDSFARMNHVTCWLQNLRGRFTVNQFVVLKPPLFFSCSEAKSGH